MLKKILITLIVSAILTGGNAMANALNDKQQSIAEVSAYAALGNQDGLKQAIITSLDKGTTVNELKEILVQVYAYCGFPRSLNALGTLMQVVEERGNKDELGKLPDPAPQGKAMEYGTENQTKLVGQPVKGKLFEFAPAIDEYLKAHLFGDIFARDNVDWQTREVATIAMLAVREGVERQLNSHINVGKNNGLTDEQVAEILNIATKAKADNVIFGFGEENTAFAKYFTGKSYLKPITTTNGVPMFNVTFEPKCRNNWHIHHGGGQILLATQGRGWYQEWGEEPRELTAGDVVNIPAGVKHWHGAAKDSWFTHIAVEVPSDNKGATEWLEPVTDEEYNKLK